MNLRALRSPWFGLALLVGGAWIGLGIATLLGPGLVRSMYEGQSFGFLNDLITGQARNPVDSYLASFAHRIAGAAQDLSVVTAIGLSLVASGRLRFGAALAAEAGIAAGSLALGNAIGSAALAQLGGSA